MKQEAFEVLFNKPMPQKLIIFYEQISRLNFPHIYHFKDKPFVLEIQYYLSSKDLLESDLKKNMLAFAKTTDGNELLFNLATNEIKILQKEDTDIDTLELKVDDILNCEINKL